ncbi:hypothetical protein DdX_02744 [Ditylenchus destructor]|uniref:Uncharacterized protein n=1 Tax=Ditylenchus destructor TaxID=166010 RepID=A0AAD4NIB6_9BILA|nr:hypothetical protein DdX_02744 [Ditylenchus destructor]
MRIVKNHLRERDWIQIFLIVMMLFECLGKGIWSLTIPSYNVKVLVFVSCSLQFMALYGNKNGIYAFFIPYLIWNFVCAIVMDFIMAVLVILMFVMPKRYTQFLTDPSIPDEARALQITFGLFLFTAAVVIYLHAMQSIVNRAANLVLAEDRECRLRKLEAVTHNFSDVAADDHVNFKPKIIYPKHLTP